MSGNRQRLVYLQFAYGSENASLVTLSNPIPIAIEQCKEVNAVDLSLHNNMTGSLS